MSKEMSLREFKRRYEAGEFVGRDFTTQVKAGWYDWFCSTGELADRLKKLWTVIRGVTADAILDGYCVQFKNTGRGRGPLYDDIRFLPLDRRRIDVDYFIVAVGDKALDYKYTIYTARKDYEIEAEFDRARDACTWINREFGGAA